MNQKILFIAPIPPPITGHAIVSLALLEELKKGATVNIVNLSKESLKDGITGAKRFIEIATIFIRTFKYYKPSDTIYLTISESLAGNLKDLVLYIICYCKLPSMFIHLHGGSIRKLLWEKYPLVFRLNKFFLRKLAGVIISGESHLSIFTDFLPLDKIKIVKNFADESLFVKRDIIEKKFSSREVIEILYIGGLIELKGYFELALGFLLLPEESKQNIRLSFAGKFESNEAKTKFLKLIEKDDRISYHGIVDADTKKSLFESAHVFCLPTEYFEGQPISILEAYASGCVVITTPKPGIFDIFEDRKNGFLVEERTPAALQIGLDLIIEKRNQLLEIALHNNKIALSTFTKDRYTDDIKKIILIHSRIF
jgi:glycosyltransferase involved in cell wall biosynthesis